MFERQTNSDETLKKMKTLEIYKTHKEEIVDQVIEQLPNAMRENRVNRTFFVKQNDDKIEVDYMVYCGLQKLSDNCFLTIKDYESFDADEFGVEDFEEIDFRALGWDAKIEESIDAKIEELEMYDNE
jgi:hypothetical protein